jgi:hypothetical protein
MVANTRRARLPLLARVRYIADGDAGLESSYKQIVDTIIIKLARRSQLTAQNLFTVAVLNTNRFKGPAGGREEGLRVTEDVCAY